MRPDFYRNQTWYRQLSVGERRFIDAQIRVGREVEMEHTDDPVIATKITLDHLVEDPYYYIDLVGCVEQGHRRRYSTVGVKPAPFGLFHNPSGRGATRRLSPTAANAYKLFHKHAPDVVDEVHGVWYPGELVKIGVGQDIGYGNDRERTDKQGWYVHDFGPSVQIFRRAKPGERADKTISNFPADSLWVLGYNLGFTYKTSDGSLHEVKGSRRKKLAATPDGKMLVVVGPGGVEFLATGGNMRVVDWIRD